MTPTDLLFPCVVAIVGYLAVAELVNLYMRRKRATERTESTHD
jgi:hypothetical protein